MRSVLSEELELLIARRRALGQDGRDEVWEGEYWMAPHAPIRHGIIEARLLVALDPWAQRAGLIACGAFNLGEPTNYRVPDGGYVRDDTDALYVPTAVVVVEVLSPDDETFRKFDHYAQHGVLEVLVAFPEERALRCYELPSGAELHVSRALGFIPAEISEQLVWPSVSG